METDENPAALEKTAITIPMFLYHLEKYPNLAWIYRGQANADWPLVPKAGRQEYFLPELPKYAHLNLAPRDILRFNHWRDLAVAYHKSMPTGDFECLAFAQHYGLATRLLDWSTNPLVALYFAIESCSDHDGVVTCFAPWSTVDVKTAVLGKLASVCFYRPPPFDARVLLQCGVFTYHPDPTEALQPATVHAELGPMTPEHGMNLFRLRIPSDIKPIMKRRLSELGINRKSLFPDLDGLSEFVNWETRDITPDGYSRRR